MSQTGEMLKLPYILQQKGDTVDIQRYRNFNDSRNVQKKDVQNAQVNAILKQYSEINQKLGNFNRRLTDLERNNLWINREFYLENEENEVSEEDVLCEQEQSMLTNDILEEVEQLYQTEDIQDQISCCVSIAEKTFQLLKIMEKTEENNYKKNVIHLFYQAIKRNYARAKFNESQIGLMVEMIKKSQENFVDEEDYFELDERLYKNKLEIFPEGE